ncbi:MAG: HAD family hydrolase [Anaerolineales bacterium]|nr:HAD family hydrolase [Anaerolineales bacterium]
MISTIGFDADDTLWHNETNYLQATEKLQEWLAGFQSPDQVAKALEETEIRNIPRYGYGIKSFTLSMIETALALSDGKIPGSEVQKILALGKGMLRAEVHLLEHAEESLSALAGGYDLILITKGDLVEQSGKVARSGVAGYFQEIEIVSEKSASTYKRLLDRHGVPPGRFLMVGNSLKSDILPVLETGGRAVYIPYQHTWSHEQIPGHKLPDRGYYELEHLGRLPALVAGLEEQNKRS